MESTKYIGMDVHKDTISVAVRNAAGKVVMESILETKAATIVQFIRGRRGNLLVTFEEGTWAAWWYDLLKPHVTQVTVCNPRQNALLKSGNKDDRIDAQKLAELLRQDGLTAVYHGENGLRTLKELSRSYLTITQDLTRVMNRLKALYHSWGIACAGTQVYAPHHRAAWLSQIPEAGVRCRAEFTTNSSTGSRRYAQECGGTFWPRAGNIGPRSCGARFRASGRSGPRFEWRSFRPPTGFAPSDHCGPTAAWRSRGTAAANIATSRVDGDAPRRR